MKYNGFDMKHANSLFCTLMNKFISIPSCKDFRLFYTRPPEGTSYEAFVGAAEKLVYIPSNQVVCYVFFRLKNAPVYEQPVLSSIEIYSCNPYTPYWKTHVTDYSSPEGIVLEAFWVAAYLMCFSGSPVASSDLQSELLSIIPSQYFSETLIPVYARILTSKSLSFGLCKGKTFLFFPQIS